LEHAHRLLEDLNSCECCVRIRAARRLGHRLCVNFCADGEVLPGLVRALLCDTCWEVRRAAAWSIAMQNARTELGVAALYVSSKMDPHYLVRDKAIEAQSVLLVCRKECFKDLFLSLDALIKSLRAAGSKPGTCNCESILASLPADSCCGGSCGAGVPATIIEKMPAPAGKSGPSASVTPLPQAVPTFVETPPAAAPLSAGTANSIATPHFPIVPAPKR
jgi:hypothetical protein